MGTENKPGEPGTDSQDNEDDGEADYEGKGVKEYGKAASSKVGLKYFRATQAAKIDRH